MQEQAIQRQAAAALAIWREVAAAVQNGAAADQALAAVYRAHPEYGSRDRRFFGQLVFSGFRWRGWVDAVPDEGVRLSTAHLLDAAKPHPALPYLGPLPDLPASGPGLEEKAAAFQRAHPSLPARWQDLVPDWTAREIELPGQPDVFRAFVEAIQQRPPLWLRARPGRREAVLGALASAGLTARPDDRLPLAIAVVGPIPAATLQKATQHGFEVQDISSQAVVALAEPHEGERWLDLCAGAGGKTLDLAERVGPHGHVVACDVRESALRELQQRARRAGLERRIAVRHLAGNDPVNAGDGPFHGVLVDAPCSGLGTWGRNPDARWRTPQSSLATHAARQLRLLEEALPQLQPGGRLVYAVCSLARTETSAVIRDFQQRHPHARVSSGPNPLSAISTPEGLWCPPSAGPGIGMFMARMHTLL